MNDLHNWENRTTPNFRLNDVNESLHGWICTKCRIVVGDVRRPETTAKISVIGQMEDLTCSELQILSVLDD